LAAVWDYPNATYAQRDQIWQAHKNYQTGLFYFLANDPSVPATIRRDCIGMGSYNSEDLLQALDLRFKEHSDIRTESG
jgi:hypothetical protein